MRFVIMSDRNDTTGKSPQKASNEANIGHFGTKNSSTSRHVVKKEGSIIGYHTFDLDVGSRKWGHSCGGKVKKKNIRQCYGQSKRHTRSWRS